MRIESCFTQRVAHCCQNATQKLAEGLQYLLSHFEWDPYSAGYHKTRSGEYFVVVLPASEKTHIYGYQIKRELRNAKAIHYTILEIYDYAIGFRIVAENSCPDLQRRYVAAQNYGDYFKGL